MNNQDFLKGIKDSFQEYINSGTSRSTAKLKPLHRAFAKAISERLGTGYEIFSQGYGNGREAVVKGRYVDKRVDITVRQNEEDKAGIAVKFVMQNYAQNSVNYFENMLGETANIRSNNIPYFQVFIILDRIPYFQKDKKTKKWVIKSWESLTQHEFIKYSAISSDKTSEFRHIPDKTLISIVHVSVKNQIHISVNNDIKTKNKYFSYYKKNQFDVIQSTDEYCIAGDGVILNDYSAFVDHVCQAIKQYE